VVLDFSLGTGAAAPVARRLADRPKTGIASALVSAVRTVPPRGILPK